MIKIDIVKEGNEFKGFVDNKLDDRLTSNFALTTLDKVYSNYPECGGWSVTLWDSSDYNKRNI